MEVVKTGSNLTSQAINKYAENWMVYARATMSMLCTNTEMEAVQLSLNINTVVDVDYVDSIHMNKQLLHCMYNFLLKSTFATL